MMKNRIKDELIKIVGEENVFVELTQRLSYRFGNVVEYRLNPPRFLPDIVVRPLTAEHVSFIIKLANEYKIPIVPWGGGTDFTGANSPIKKGIVLDMKALDSVKLNKIEQSLTAGAGTTLKKISEVAEKHDLLFQHELTIQPSATIGGAIANASFGYRSGQYRSIRNLILGIEVVLPTGEIIRTKPLFKTSTGYDIVSLFVGSEGTLGIITEVTLKLVPRPRNRRITSYVFGSFDSGLQAINEIQKTTTLDFFTLTELSFLKYSRSPVEFIIKNLNSKFISWYVESKYVKKKGYIESLDKIFLNFPYTKMIFRHINDTLMGEGCLTILMIGFEGERDIIKHRIRDVDTIVKSFDGFKFEDSSEHEKKFSSHLERFKEVIFEQFQEYSQSFRIATFDVSSPLSRVLEVKKLIHDLLENYSPLKLLDIELFSSIGNIDFEVIFPSDDGDSYFKFLDELNTSLLKLGCSLSFAHGVGTRFLPYLNADIGKEQLKLIQRIKKAMDPKNILNPGKIGGAK